MFFCDLLFFCHRCKLIVVMVAKASNILKVSKVLKVLIKTQFKRCAYSKGSMTPMVFLKGLCHDVSNDFILPLFISIMHGIGSCFNGRLDSLYLRGGGMKDTDLDISAHCPQGSIGMCMRKHFFNCSFFVHLSV